MADCREVWLCATCGVEYEPAPRPPEHCPICDDERQYVPATGQRWTTIGELRQAGHTIDVTPVADDLWGLTAVPQVGIGQQSMLIKTPAGNVMFDVPGYIDQAAVETVRALGGINAIVASHPHMYGVQSAWSQAFDDAAIWVAGADAQWLGYRPAAVREWSEPFDVVPGVRLDQVGGHFAGSTIAAWRDGAAGRGIVFAGDAIFPVADGNVTFLRSYPNRIPLSAPVVRRIADQVAGYGFEFLYNNFGASVGPGARQIVLYSAHRYIDWVSGARDAET